MTGLSGPARRLVMVAGRRARAEVRAARHAVAVRRRLSGAASAPVSRVDVLSAGRETAALLGPVRDALSAAGVRYFAIPEPPPNPPRLAMPAGEITTVVAALAAAPESAEWGLSPLHSPWLRGSHPVSIRATQVTNLLRVHPCWMLHRNLRSVAGRPVQDRYGVRLEVWHVGEDPATGLAILVAPCQNERVDFVVEKEEATEEMVVAGVALPTFRDLAAPAIDDVGFPIDVVYTWVDGTDARWVSEFAANVPEHSLLAEHAASASRFSASDELRYSVRSLEAYMPWVRCIYLVTAGQRPLWLHESERLRLVSHQEIWEDLPGLPTFNSHAIESRLHHIDGLAEHFVYFNDDIIVSRPLQPRDFFLANGMIQFFPSSAKIGIGEPRTGESATSAAGKNNRRLIRDAFGTTLNRKMWHVPHPHRRSVLAELERRFPDEFRRVAASKFRSVGDISVASNLGQYYGFVTGQAVPGRLRYRYLPVDEPGVGKRLRQAERDGIEVLCLNERGVVDDERRAASLADAARYLEERFPCRSVHEDPSSPP